MYASILQYVRSLRASRLVGAGLAASVAIAVGATGCDQSTPLCRTGTGPYTIKYTLRSGTGTCADLKTDTIYVNSYNDVGDEGKPDLERVSAALAPSALAAHIDRANVRLGLDEGASPDPAHNHWAWGHFLTAEPVGDFCDITFDTKLNAADVDTAQQSFPKLPEVPEVPGDDNGTPNDKCDDTPLTPKEDEEPATNIAYKFSNWHIYFTPAHAGNSFSVHLSYSVDGNTCEYDGQAALFGQRQGCDKGDGTPLAQACEPIAYPDVQQVKHSKKNSDPSKGDVTCDAATGEYLPGKEYINAGGLGTGSGVDPDFAVTCDEPTLTCVLAKEVPALR